MRRRTHHSRFSSFRSMLHEISLLNKLTILIAIIALAEFFRLYKGF